MLLLAGVEVEESDEEDNETKMKRLFDV